ncbi:centrosome-associated protein 350-like [Amphibalanus amphitrite]|uniref:centrosome-associated protein 350-like n=1 Tax=Amphibalanus amphitrite TaxID=1232801 RepID=UPI001C906E21|nr:centrosome-associated protein 350-like [Amphibalanus amphitrite]
MLCYTEASSAGAEAAPISSSIVIGWLRSALSDHLLSAGGARRPPRTTARQKAAKASLSESRLLASDSTASLRASLRSSKSLSSLARSVLPDATQFTLDIMRQQLQEEERHSHHRMTLLRVQEKQLVDSTTAQIKRLEMEKRKCKEEGQDEKVSAIRKKQRALIMKLNQRKAEIEWLKEGEQLAAKDRQLIASQQEQLARAQLTGRDRGGGTERPTQPQQPATK